MRNQSSQQNDNISTMVHYWFQTVNNCSSDTIGHSDDNNIYHFFICCKSIDQIWIFIVDFSMENLTEKHAKNFHRNFAERIRLKSRQKNTNESLVKFK